MVCRTIGATSDQRDKRQGPLSEHRLADLPDTGEAIARFDRARQLPPGAPGVERRDDDEEERQRVIESFRRQHGTIVR